MLTVANCNITRILLRVFSSKIWDSTLSMHKRVVAVSFFNFTLNKYSHNLFGMLH